MNQFNTGDVVQLKSGGPKMTVVKVDDFESGSLIVVCSWFVGTKKETASFPPDALEKATQD